MHPSEILKKYWGHEKFRPLQEEIISAVMQKKDVLALLPTGGGKSVCFQVPAMMNDGLCLVVSPLIALMKDQVENLRQKGINALAVYSGMSFSEVRQTLQNASFGNYKFLYVSPERLETKLFLEYLPALQPSLIAVDEAHCISQWGYDFRPSYLRIAQLREELPGVPLIALTASATPGVQDDICEKLLFRKGAERFHQSFIRPELSYSSFIPVSKENKLLEILANVKGSSIVYCKSRKQTMKVAELLKMKGVSADYYHAGLTSAQRTEKQEDWIRNKIRTIVCTNAFGMGIDKPDVRAVVHFDMPDCLENYYQEAGRAGRDGKRAYAVLLHYEKEAAQLFDLLDIKYPDAEKAKQIYTALMNHLQVAAGTGEGLSFEIDIASFAQHFKFNILEATYGIQMLAQEGLLSYSELMFKNSTAEFLANKTDLAEFETQHPELEPVIKGLLRSYEGIFDFPSVIYESLLAKFLKIPAEKLVADLKRLHTYGIIRYKAASEKPEILLLKNRMYNDDFKIDTGALTERKKEAAKRTSAIRQYAEESNTCRSKMIADYFGDTGTKDCGICDNCIKRAEGKTPAGDFKKITGDILQLLKEKPGSSKEIIEKMHPVPETEVWKAIRFLLAEEVIRADGENRLSL